jgi:hypothetical protein
MWYQVTICYHRENTSAVHGFSMIVSEAVKDAIIATYLGGTDGKVRYDDIIVRGNPGNPIYGTAVVNWQEDDIFAIDIHEAGEPVP